MRVDTFCIVEKRKNNLQIFLFNSLLLSFGNIFQFSLPIIDFITGAWVPWLFSLTYLITSRRKMAAVARLGFRFADSITPSVSAIFVYSCHSIWDTSSYLLMNPDILPGEFSQLFSFVSYLVFFVPLLLLLSGGQNGIQT